MYSKYRSYLQNLAYQNWVKQGEESGTVGQGLRMEAIEIKLEDVGTLDAGIRYQTYLQDFGWQAEVQNGQTSGTTNESRRIEAIKILLFGNDVADLSVWYQAQCEKIGWMNWCRDGEVAGTAGGSLRLETIRILVLPKNIDLKVSGADGFKQYVKAPEPAQPQVSGNHGSKSGNIYLAVGHGISQDGSWDSGCVDGNYTEADLMLAIGKVAVAKLREWGLNVSSDADTDNDKNIIVGVALANSLGTDIYISLHCDYNAAPSGTLPIIYPGSDSGMNLANCVNNAVMARMGIGTRGVIQEGDQLEVNTTDMTACIFETGSIRADIDILLNAQAYGEAVAQGIYNYF
ncbi:hypothetical protein GH810_14505 [Acetobacterium paludosum]|uniref:MurNAc-LAA domain-containing protein n=1 Tax=Acetobacterium paludosum TaxID=52693 RepID=A0A923KTK4_9FIRM|nr:N-acetylmuramoyl-L-alanine amidase [Acetobacterium paludosum]MBC3889522.1 hypothetical protein [Acetobacterium paludosum]